LLTEALISIGPRNLKLVQKIISKRNLRQIFRTRVEISELNKKIKQIKKIEGYNQKKDRKNTTTIEIII
jgi:hypothetical protein